MCARPAAAVVLLRMYIVIEDVAVVAAGAYRYVRRRCLRLVSSEIGCSSCRYRSSSVLTNYPAPRTASCLFLESLNEKGT